MDDEDYENDDEEEKEDTTIYTDDIPLSLGCDYFPSKLSKTAVVNMKTKRPVIEDKTPNVLSQFLKDWGKRRNK